MQELHLKQPGFTGGACGPLTKKLKYLDKQVTWSTYIEMN